VNRLAEFISSDAPGIPSAFENFEDASTQTHPHWFVGGFPWDEVFSARQAGNALSLEKRSPLRFDKVVRTIHLCAAAAEALQARSQSQVGADDVLDKMRIEPALSYVTDLNKDAMKLLEDADPDLLRSLRDACGQTNSYVFETMTQGYTVTNSLAEKVLSYLSDHHPNLPLGPVSSVYFEGSRGAAIEETLRD